jgi:pyrimidine deaminase RibD-like protein
MVDRDAPSEPSAFSAAEQEQFMALALAESRQALPSCLPNPPVGCVIVGDGVVLARGFTGAPGAPHAEAAALRALDRGMRSEALALFVTLEPCAFVGRTPSCAQAIVASGIRRVFVGTLDPDARNDGAGITIMRRAGIVVRVGVCEPLVRAFIAPYLLSGPGA